MDKDFDGWIKEKKEIHGKKEAAFYHPREIWWCSLGVNVGSEQDGTGSKYDRPVLIIKGFNTDLCFGVALTGKKKTGKYYHYLGKVGDRDSSVVLSQARAIDTKRLIRKVGTIDTEVFKAVKESLRKILLG